MSGSIREHLLGYVLGVLDHDEQALVEHHLHRDASLRQELENIAERVKPLSYDRDEVDYLPPVDLAARTCAHLAIVSEEESFTNEQTVATASVQQVVLPASRRMREVNESVGRSRWHLADVCMVVGVCIVAAVLFFPAIANSRHQSRILACQANLKELGFSLASYSERHNGLPEIPLVGNRSAAGIYAPMLMDSGFLPDKRTLLCPSSQLAQKSNQWTGVPTLQQIDEAEGKELHIMRESMGGSYGYNLGYFSDGQYTAARKRAMSMMAIVSDAPSLHLAGHASSNHAGLGQNVLFADMHIQFVLDSIRGLANDALFLNNERIAEAGINEFDSVIGRSSAPPIIDNAEDPLNRFNEFQPRHPMPLTGRVSAYRPPQAMHLLRVSVISSELN